MEYTPLSKESKMGKQQQVYTREFKVEAVQLVKSSGKPMSQVARELGISDSALYHWSKQLADQGEQAFPGSGHQTARGGRKSVG
jgi:transposase